MAEDAVRSGGCFCGAVRFEATGAPVNLRVCHCGLCQRAMAGPFFARALYNAPQVRIIGELGRFNSSVGLERLFCPRCGTRVGAGRPSAGRVSLALALFDPPCDLTPECHFFVAFKAPWLALSDGLPQYPEWPPD